MPQFVGPLTINDGATTPVAVGFAPELLSSSQTVLVDRRLVSREQQPTLTILFDRASTNRKTYKVKHLVAMPLVRNVAGVDVVQDTARVNIEYVLPQSMTGPERKNLRAYITNLQGVAAVKAGVEDLDPLY